MPEIDDSRRLSSDDMAPPAKEFYKETFSPTYELQNNRLEEFPLLVLVWGPGEGSNELYQKRCQIREKLRALGHAALFSEEIEQDHPHPELPLNIRELHQAEGADCIIVIQSSPGSTGEVHDFSPYLTIAHKMLIFIDQRYQEGYSYKGTLRILSELYNNVVTYKNPEDVMTCEIMRISEDKVRVWQWAKYLISKRRAVDDK